MLIKIKQTAKNVFINLITKLKSKTIFALLSLLKYFVGQHPLTENRFEP
jgi:hypothetical protein